MKKIGTFFCFLFLFSQVRGDIDWSSPVTLSTSTVNASNPQIVMDGNGNATVAWLESDLIKISSQPVNGNWGSATTLSNTGASSPCLAVDASGNVFALWLENGVVKAATQPFGSSWGSAVSVSDTGASSPALAVDSSTGNLVAVWARSSYIESATQVVGSSWGQVSVISNSNSDSPQVAASNGTAAAVWHTISSGQNIVLAATGTVGSVWNTAQTLAQDSFNHISPYVAIDALGNVQMVWFRYDTSGLNYTNVSVMASTLSNGSNTWSSPIPISSQSPKGNYNPTTLSLKIACDANGNTAAVWSNSYYNDLFNFEGNVLPVGGTWASSDAVVGNNLYAYAGDVAVDSYGNTIIAFMNYDGYSSVLIQTAETDLSAAASYGYLFWTVSDTISQGTQNGFPKIASTSIGSTINATAVWINNNGSNNVIQASSGSRTILGPPSNPIVTQNVNNWGVFQEYYNTLTWTASTDPNTVGYNIYKNDVYYTQAGTSPTELIDDNVVENGTVNYSIASIDDNNAQSVPVSVTFPSKKK